MAPAAAPVDRPWTIRAISSCGTPSAVLNTDLAREAAASDPAGLAGQLQLLYDGANISARMDRDRSAGIRARAAAVTLLDAAIAG